MASTVSSPRSKTLLSQPAANDVCHRNDLCAAAQALEEERLGPRREPYSDERQKRLAVQEAATALLCTLMPAIEPLTLVRPAPPAFANPLQSAWHGRGPEATLQLLCRLCARSTHLA